MEINLAIQVIIFIFGLLVGSFLNAVIYRLKENKTILFDRSICPSCKHKLKALDLVPVFSFIFLKGRCRYCHQKISWQYPLVELATGTMFLLIFNFLPLKAGFKQFSTLNSQVLVNLIYLWFISSFLLIIFIYDLKYWLIPDEMIYSSIILVFLYHIYFLLLGNETIIFFLKNYLFAGAISAFFFFAIWFVSKGKWMGFGDVKLAFLIGLFLGPQAALIALFSAFFMGAIIGLGLIVFQGKKLKSQIPFAPFLVFGAFLAQFFSKLIMAWYLNLIL